MNTWTQQEAIALCRLIAPLTAEFGCYVALTGGTLYADGPRKDCDILFYRNRQIDKVNVDGLFRRLISIGFRDFRGVGWCIKANYNGKAVDCFFPDCSGEYPSSDQTDIPIAVELA